MHCRLGGAGRLAVALLCALGVIGAWPAAAETANGGPCRVRDVRVVNTSSAMIREKLWSYGDDKAPYDPIFGWVDLACADRGVSRSKYQDIGTRIWFNVAGPDSAAANMAKISFTDQQMRAEGNTLGLTTDGLTILGEVSPKHACVFSVTVWSDTCPAR